MRAAPLTTVNGGIDRLRVTGGARADTLYDLTNAYVTEAGTIRPRPGTIRKATLHGTKGLVGFAGKLHVFATSLVSVPAGFICHVLAHPTIATATLRKIHFAKPIMGFLYIVAEFNDGSVYHYWLESLGAWIGYHNYKKGDIVEPAIPNGLLYEASRLGPPNPAWAPRVTRTVGDVVEPTTYNDYFYQVTAAVGNNPASGATEPEWPVVDGGVVTEDSDPAVNSAVAPATPELPAPVPINELRYRR